MVQQLKNAGMVVVILAVVLMDTVVAGEVTIVTDMDTHILHIVMAVMADAAIAEAVAAMDMVTATTAAAVAVVLEAGGNHETSSFCYS